MSAPSIQVLTSEPLESFLSSSSHTLPPRLSACPVWLLLWKYMESKTSCCPYHPPPWSVPVTFASQLGCGIKPLPLPVVMLQPFGVFLNSQSDLKQESDHIFLCYFDLYRGWSVIQVTSCHLSKGQSPSTGLQGWIQPLSPLWAHLWSLSLFFMPLQPLWPPVSWMYLAHSCLRTLAPPSPSAGMVSLFPLYSFWLEAKPPQWGFLWLSIKIADPLYLLVPIRFPI